MVEIALNLRFLLWQDEMLTLQKSEKISKWPHRGAKWFQKLAVWAECDISRAEAILTGAEVSQMELNNIKQNKPLTEDEFITLTNTNILNLQIDNKELNIWQENVIFLLEKLEHGENAKLVRCLNVNQTTLSKWKKKTHLPEKKHRNVIQQFFNLPNQIDLEREPLFLSIDPINTHERKLWLCEKIHELPEQKLNDFFPALKCLLESS